jgi:hypothetical protein
MARFRIVSSEFQATAHDARQIEVRRARLTNGKNLFYFVAGARDTYTVTISGPAGTPPAPCQLTLMASPRPRIEYGHRRTPRLPPGSVRQLQRDLQARREAAVAGFLRMVEKQGTPLVEPLPSGSQRMRCTFVWRGNAHTRAVLVNLPPYSRLSKETPSANSGTAAERSAPSKQSRSIWQADRPYQPTGLPRFCSSSHFFSGA